MTNAVTWVEPGLDLREELPLEYRRRGFPSGGTDGREHARDTRGVRSF